MVKICDFGLTRDVGETGYFSEEDQSGGLAIRWMSIEPIDHGVFTTQTDVVCIFTYL